MGMSHGVPGLAGSRYELRRELGRGAYGVVHEAFDRETSRVVALKVLDDRSPESSRRFKREFRIAREISHPNVAELFELTAGERNLFMTLELVRGEEFDVHARKHPERLSDLLIQLARGIRALHVHGVLHRDLKPSNVLVDGAGRVVVLDFGLATELEGSAAPLTSPGVVRGTPAYMSPEQAQGEAASEAGDWYAFGAMAYECLAGHPPHLDNKEVNAGSYLALLFAKIKDDAPDLAKLAPDAPPELVALIMELLTRDPKRRPRGADVLQKLGAPSEDALDATGARQRSQVFVGREAELAALHAAHDRLAQGKPSTVCMRGAFGMGKSTLLARFEAELRKQPDTLVLMGRCSPHETMPFRAFDGVIDELATEGPALRRASLVLSVEQAVALELVFPVLSGRLATARPARGTANDFDTPRGPRGRSLAFAALRLLLCELARDQQVVLCIEDVHWADSDSAAAMRALRAGDAPLPVLILMTCEVPWSAPDGFAAQVDEEIRTGQIEEVALSALSDEDAEQLMVVLSMRADSETRELARRARGVPLLVRELAREVRTGRSASLLPKPGGEPALEQLVRARLSTLDPGQRDVLQLLATSATALSADQLQRLLPAREAEKLIEGLVALGLLERAPSAVRLALEPMREWILSPLDTGTRRALHLRVADALLPDHQPAQAAALSYHYREGERGDLARSYASVAARTAANQMAFGQAARLYDDAIRLHGADTAEAKALRSELSQALVGGDAPADITPVFLPACGDLVGSKYRINDLLGRGGMGAVFSATNVRTGKHVALKWLLPHKSDAHGASARFLREAQAAGRIHHPNVVDVYDVGEHEGSTFLVMELLRGEPLSARLERGPLTRPEVFDVMLPVLQGIAAAHEKGVVHRDLKPHNIFLSEGETASAPRVPKVLDFGISKIGETFDGSTSDTITREGTILGTPQYMAPEQLRGLPDVDARADIYSLGVILYALLTGELPFKGKSHNELVFQVATDTPTAPDALRPEIGGELSRVVLRAMARNRDDRFASVRELERALVHLPEPGKAAPAASKSSSSYGLIALIVCVVLALSFVALRNRSAEPEMAPAPAAVKEKPATTAVAPAPSAPSVAPAPVVEPEKPVEEPVPEPGKTTRVRGEAHKPAVHAAAPQPTTQAPPLTESVKPQPTVPSPPKSPDDNRAGGISLDDFK